jgi:multimeric flavodoxin WrbA
MQLLILDGQPSATEEAYNSYLKQLVEHLTNKGHTLSTITLRDMNIRSCAGCWGCWVKTPGECVFKDDNTTVCQEYINSDFVLFVSPIIMGFSSALLKMTQDRLIPLVHPYFEFAQGELHHIKRYEKYPLIGLLLEKTPGTDDEDIEITVDLFKRFSINFKTEFVLDALMSQSAQEVSDAIDRI